MTQHERKATATCHHKGGFILVMDDELMIRTIASQMLQSLGYESIDCENGTEAISLYQSALDAGTPFDAVIMDLMVDGGMGGEEAARLILALDPHARLVASSGSRNHPIMADCQKYGFCSAMPKPYNTADISRILVKIFQDKLS